jgi:hypothetical protein
MSKFTPKDITPSGGFFNQLSTTLRLIARLMADSRVNVFLKAIPVGGLAYLIWPLDLMPGMPFDDAAIVLGALYMFIELCPPQVVAEHRAAIQRVVPTVWHDPEDKKVEPPDVVEGEFHDVGGWESQSEKEKGQK